MGQYTEFFEDIRGKISPEDSDYKDKLIQVAASFRTFDVALDDFIVNRGFEGELSDVQAKIRFIRERFQSEGMDIEARTIKKWYGSHTMSKNRDIAFQFCFAFGLDIEETQEFFRKVYLQRGIDCHDMNEAVYYYAILHRMSYAQAQELIARLPKPASRKLSFDESVLFTGTIVKELHRFQSAEELLTFLEENVEQFGYNNATAYKYIGEIWNQIACEGGIAERERRISPYKLKKSKKGKEGETVVPVTEENEDKKRSVWEIYLQIFGLKEFDDNNTPLFVLENRTIKPILKKNPLLHPLAEEAFPDRQGLEGILRGEHQSAETVRKTMILLTFYRYWCSLALKHNEFYYSPSPEECGRCYASMNQYLVSAGYPELYQGNPYDWIFMYSSQDEYPLDTFRDFMRELYLEQEEALRID